MTQTLAYKAQTYAEIIPTIEEHLKRWYESHGISLDDPSVKENIKRNTVIVPERVESNLRVLRKFTPLNSLEGKRILDVGAGFCTFAMYLLLTEKPSEIVAIDYDPSVLSKAEDMARDCGLENISFFEDDMRVMKNVPGQFDVVILNGALPYFPDQNDLASIFESVKRVLKPGGYAIIYTSNGLYYKDAFTRLKYVHFLPRPLLVWYLKTFKKIDYSGYKLPSPFRIQGDLKKTGFENVKIISPFGPKDTGVKRFYNSFFFALAQKK
ncbi:MAG: class I SAM-dependent methyltransferase [Cyanobacteria bacterium]|nr:class I SAM-dependent methyltransferase [Cyanobacteriota bacterium]